MNSDGEMCEMRLYEALYRVLHKIRQTDPSVHKEWRDVAPRFCSIAHADHLLRERRYMHVYCPEVGGSDEWICVAPAAVDLPIDNLHGLFAHELGHLISGDRRQSVANDTMLRFGIRIEYDEMDVQWARL